MSNHAIDPAGLQAMLEASSRIGATANGGLRQVTYERDPNVAKLLLFEGRRIRRDSGEILITRGFREFAALALRVIQQGQREGSFSRALKAQSMVSALLGAAESLLRDRLVAARQRLPSPFPETQMRAVFAALIAGLEP